MATKVVMVGQFRMHFDMFMKKVVSAPNQHTPILDMLVHPCIYMLHVCMFRAQSMVKFCFQGWQCVSKFCKKVATCLGYVDVSTGSEEDLLNAVYTLGPVR